MNKFEGDPKIFIDEDGARFEWINGQPVMDQWLENSFLLSAFVPEWYGNYFFDTEEEKFKSTLLSILAQALTLDTINNAKDAIEKATKHMIDLGLVNAIDVNIYNPTGYRVTIDMTITAINGNIKLLTIANVGSQWVVR